MTMNKTKHVLKTKHAKRTATVLADLTQTFDGAVRVLAVAAEGLDDLSSGSTNPSAGLLRDLCQQRKDFRHELEELATQLEHHLDTAPPSAAEPRHDWHGLDALLKSSDDQNVMRAVETGEEIVLRIYTGACQKELAPRAQVLINHHRGAISASFARLHAMAELRGETTKPN